MSKSGFEIRADLLSQAQGMLAENHNNQVMAIQYNNEVLDQKTPLPVNTVTTADVIRTAKELYEFVNEKQ
jgi:hypothetical protein